MTNAGARGSGVAGGPVTAGDPDGAGDPGGAGDAAFVAEVRAGRPRNLWVETAAERFEAPPLAGALRVDVAIVGGGILGLRAALALAEAGAAVAVLEAGRVGAGASGASGGLVVPSLPRVGPGQAVEKLGETGERLIAAVVAGADEVFALVGRHQIRCDAEQTGWLHPAHAASLAGALEAKAEAWRAAGAAVTVLGAAETRARIGSARFHGALFDATGGHLNPVAYVRGLARAAAAAGADIREASAVTAIAREDGRWRLRAAQGSVIADAVVEATNGQSPGLASAADAATVPLFVSQMATEVLSPAVRASVLPAREAMSDTRHNLFAVRPTADGRLGIGAMAALTQAWAVPRLARVAERRLAAVFPQLAGVRIAMGWRGRATLTGDFLPRLFALGPGRWAPVACNGRGIVMATILGRSIGEALARGDADALLLTPAPPRRLPARPLAAKLPQLLLPLGILADRRAERRR